MGSINYDIVFRAILKDGLYTTINGNDNREELNYTDVFYPKLVTIMGADGVLTVLKKEKSVLEVMQDAGLDKEDYEALGRTFAYGLEAWEKEPTEERLSEISLISDKLISGYVDKVRNHLISMQKDVSHFDENVENSYGNNVAIFQQLEREVSKKIA